MIFTAVQTGTDGSYVRRAMNLTFSIASYRVIDRAVTIGGCYTCGGQTGVQCQHTRSYEALPFLGNPKGWRLRRKFRLNHKSDEGRTHFVKMSVMLNND
jgi:hypothetical protein